MLSLLLNALSTPINISCLFTILSCVWFMLVLMHWRAAGPVDLLSPSTFRSGPLVSVIVPARNEQDCIRRCLTSLLRQNYPNLEIILINDNSFDNTLQVAKSIIDKRLKIISINKTPLGWSGKSWASHAGYLASQGRILLFTDADSNFFNVDAMSKAVSFMVNKQASIITGQPLIELKDIYSQLVMPLYNFFNDFYDDYTLHLRPKGSISPLIGSFFMIDKKILDSLGGFSCVRSSIQEDTDLGLSIIRAGHLINHVKASKFVSAMWSRDKRTLLEGVKRIVSHNLERDRLSIVFDLMCVAGLVLVPFILLPFTYYIYGVHDQRYLLLSWNFVLCMLPIIGLFFTIKTKHNISPIFSLLVLFSSGLYLVIYLSTMIRFIWPLPSSAKFIRWKGRQYYSYPQHPPFAMDINVNSCTSPSSTVKVN